MGYYYYDDYRKYPAPAECFVRGVLATRLVARLAGATTRQLGYWHSWELIVATVAPRRRGVSRLYSWIDYSRARAAIQLMDSGVRRTCLLANIDWLEANLPRWYEIPLSATPIAENSVAAPPEHRPHRTAADIRRWMSAKLAEDTPARPSLVETDALADMLEAIYSEGPLGVLAEFGDVVGMDPQIRAGLPVIRGSRVETGFLAGLEDRGLDVKAIAERVTLEPWQVERALAFEHAIAA